MIKKYIYTFQNTLGNKFVFKYTKKKKWYRALCVNEWTLHHNWIVVGDTRQK